MLVQTVRDKFLGYIGTIRYEESVAAVKEAGKVDFAYLSLIAISAFIATLGLITDSAAVIIGAMILSPLMSPIILSGASFAIMDTELSKTAAKSLLTGIVLALACSIITVIVSPVKVNTAEILARTSPTILDLCIAFFCGLSGALSIVSEKISKSMVGVAISVALMPPLCVGGFGLATAQPHIAMGGLWMFFLNMAAIFVTTFGVLSLCGYASYFGVKRTHNSFRWFLSISMLVILSIPLAISLKNSLQRQREQIAIQTALTQMFTIKERSVLQKVEFSSRGDVTHVSVFTDTIKKFDTAYIRSAEQNVTRLSKTNVSLSLVQRGVLSITNAHGEKSALFEGLRLIPTQKNDDEQERVMSQKKDDISHIVDVAMASGGIEAYHFDTYTNTVTVSYDDTQTADIQTVKNVAEALRPYEVATTVDMNNTVVYQAPIFNSLDTQTARALSTIAEYAEQNGLSLTVDVGLSAKRLREIRPLLQVALARAKTVSIQKTGTHGLIIHATTERSDEKKTD